jgi:hypothetical protein
VKYCKSDRYEGDAALVLLALYMIGVTFLVTYRELI